MRRKKERAKGLKIMFMILISLFLTAGFCFAGGTQEGADTQSTTAAAAPVAKDTLAVGISAGILTLDPANHRDRTTETVIRNIFDGLVTRGPDMKIVPEIAESWNWLDDKTCEFKIRHGVTFHNGDPCTADDVVFTFNRIIKEGAMGGESSPRKSLLGPLTDVKKIDDYTVQFILSSPWPVLLGMLPHQQIVPKKYIESVGTEEFRKHPIGAGPFKFVEGQLNERIVVERYDGYYGGAPALSPVGTAKVKRVIFEVIPEVATRVTALTTGECDIIQSVPQEYVPVILGDSDCAVTTGSGTRSYMVEMNVNKPPFDKLKVRQAMNYAVDMQALITRLFAGKGSEFAGPSFPYEEMVDSSLKPYGYDPEKAKKLLAEAGYPDGFSVVMDAKTAEKEQSEFIAGMLSEVGINCTVRLWDWAVVKPLLLNGERSLCFGSWGSSILDPIGYIEAKLLTKGRGNYSQYSNPEVDKLIHLGEITVDPAKRKEIYKKLQEITYKEAPWIFGYAVDETYGYRKDVTGWVPIPDTRINLHDVGFK